MTKLIDFDVVFTNRLCQLDIYVTALKNRAGINFGTFLKTRKKGRKNTFLVGHSTFHKSSVAGSLREISVKQSSKITYLLFHNSLSGLILNIYFLFVWKSMSGCIIYQSSFLNSYFLSGKKGSQVQWPPKAS